MDERIYLAIDSGTTRLKAALVGQKSGIIALASRDATVEKPREGWCEMDMPELYRLLCGAVRELGQKAPEALAAVCGLGISAQGDGCWPIDADGVPVGKAMLWCDTRAKTAPVPDREGLSAFLTENHCTQLVVGTIPTSLLWLKRERPGDYRRIRWALHCKDWLNYCLTGEIYTDYSDRSTAVIDIFKKEYLPGLFERLGIPEALELQPPMLSSTDIVGRVTARAAAETGLPEGTPVIAGAIDLAAVALGAGVVNTGDGCSVLGTSLCNVVLVEQQQVDHRQKAGSTLCSIVPERYIRQMATLNGCSAMDWAKSVLAPDLSYPELDKLVAKAPAGAGGIIYHPYLCGSRAPVRDPDACGGFYGLTARATREDMMRAVYEGIVMSVTDCFSNLPLRDGTLTISGGGARCSLICQLVADSLGRRVQRPAGEEFGILGIACAVQYALTGELSAPAGELTYFTPDEENHRKLRSVYERYKALAETMAPHWASRAEALKQL